jgi:hypothetical protein
MSNGVKVVGACMDLEASRVWNRPWLPLTRHAAVFAGKQLVKFLVENSNKKVKLNEITDEVAAVKLADELLAAGSGLLACLALRPVHCPPCVAWCPRRHFHPVMPSPDGRPNWYQPQREWKGFVKSSRQKYVWDHEESRGKLIALLSVVVVVAIWICMFPVWPMWMKRGLHYVLVTLLAAIVIFLVLRMLVYGAVWLFGYEFWVLPNVLNEEEDMFKPVYTFEKSQGVQMWHRAVAVALLGLFVYWVVTQPTDFERMITAQKDFMADLYSGSILGDATQADRDRMRGDATIDEEIPDLDETKAPDEKTTYEPHYGEGKDVRADGSVHTDYDHLDYEPDVPLGEDEEE